MRIFKNKIFNKYAGKQNITNGELCKAVAEIESGLIDTNYGSNLFKKRIAKKGKGKSGGHRAILAYVKGDKTFFMYGFEKKRQRQHHDKRGPRLQEAGQDIYRSGRCTIDGGNRRKHFVRGELR